MHYVYRVNHIFFTALKNYRKVGSQHALCHYWEQEFRATEVARKIYKVEGSDVVSILTAQKWFNIASLAISGQESSVVYLVEF